MLPSCYAYMADFRARHLYPGMIQIETTTAKACTWAEQDGGWAYPSETFDLSLDAFRAFTADAEGAGLSVVLE